MSAAKTHCPKCNSAMVQGFIVDFNLAGRMVISWVEGGTREVHLDRDESAYRKDHSCGHLPLFGLRIPRVVCAAGIRRQITPPNQPLQSDGIPHSRDCRT